MTPTDTPAPPPKTKANAAQLGQQIQKLTEENVALKARVESVEANLKARNAELADFHKAHAEDTASLRAVAEAARPIQKALESWFRRPIYNDGGVFTGTFTAPEWPPDGVVVANGITAGMFAELLSPGRAARAKAAAEKAKEAAK
jgi:hypothetical protein